MSDQNANMTEGAMTPEELKDFREQRAKTALATKRQETLKEMLEKDEQKDVYSELYQKWGLKEMFDKEPELLDNKTLAIRAAGVCKKEMLAQQKMTEQEEKAKAAVAQKPADVTPPSDQTKGAPAAPKEFNKASKDVFHPEFLEKLPANSAQRAFFEMNKPKPNESWR